MALKILRLSKKMLFSWLLLIGAVFYLAPQRITRGLNMAWTKGCAPVLKLSRNVASLSSAFDRPYPADMVSRSDLNSLTNAYENLKAELITKQREFDALSGIRNRFPALHTAAFVTADVISRNPSRLGHRITINRGRNDGLVAGLYVMGDRSIIGTIEEISATVATVKLITDPSATLFAMTENATGVLSGTGSDRCTIQLSSKLATGTVIYAGKRPGLLDAPMIVGTVAESVTSSSPLLYDISVMPACDIDKLDSVTVIIMNPQGR